MSELNGLNPFLKSKRIYLREIRPSDVNDACYRWINDQEITRYLKGRFSHNSMKSIADYVSSKLADRDNVFLAIVIEERDQHIGNITVGPSSYIH